MEWHPLQMSTYITLTQARRRRLRRHQRLRDRDLRLPGGRARVGGHTGGASDETRPTGQRRTLSLNRRGVGSTGEARAADEAATSLAWLDLLAYLLDYLIT